MTGYRNTMRAALRPAWPTHPRSYTPATGNATPHYEVYFQNCQGLFPNIALLQAKLATQRWDIIALAETWTTALPPDLQPLLRSYRYYTHILPAKMSCVPTARDRCGILLIIRDTLHATNVLSRRTDYGEYICVTITNLCRLFVVYHTCTNTAAAYDRTLDVFSDAHSPLPTLWLGDYNWTIQRPNTPGAQPPLTSCKHPPPGSTFSKQQAALVTRRLAAYPLHVISGFASTH